MGFSALIQEQGVIMLLNDTRHCKNIDHLSCKQALINQFSILFENKLFKCNSGVKSMKKLLQAALFSIVIAAVPAFAHHAAEGVVDADVYEMIDELLADSAQAEMTIDDLAYTMDITTRTVTQMENLIDDGLLDYAAMLDATVTITFDADGSVIMSISY